MSKQEKIPFGSKRQPHIVPMEQAMDSRALAKHHVLERGESEPERKPARKKAAARKRGGGGATSG